MADINLRLLRLGEEKKEDLEERRNRTEIYVRICYAGQP